MAMLVYSAPGEQDRQFELGARTVIGRHPGCQVQILDGLVSKEHCEIVARDRSHWIRDLGTTNGTWVNGVRLLTERRLEHLDEISAARARLLFLDPGAALRRSPTGDPYRKAARAPSEQPPPRPDVGDLPSLRRFYALVRMLCAESNLKQLASDASHGLLTLCDVDWAVLCVRDASGAFTELARAGREKPPDVSAPYPALFDVAANARAPTFQLAHDRVLQLVVPLVHADTVQGVFWVGMASTTEISPVLEVLSSYGAFVAVALRALDGG
ncbi:MAG: FHA domain-containing protein [Myxococcales bacterium]|nr:FHA domain-containing protein [Myxococcales bacterium]